MYAVFGHEDYRGKQREIVETAILSEPQVDRLCLDVVPELCQDVDIFVVAPTGMGKV